MRGLFQVMMQIKQQMCSAKLFCKSLANFQEKTHGEVLFSEVAGFQTATLTKALPHGHFHENLCIFLNQLFCRTCVNCYYWQIRMLEVYLELHKNLFSHSIFVTSEPITKRCSKTLLSVFSERVHFWPTQKCILFKDFQNLKH